jgi:hypothetical protein
MEMLRRFQEQQEFFQEMESNVYESLSKGKLPGSAAAALEPMGMKSDKTGELSWKISNKVPTYAQSITSATTCTDSLSSDSDQSIDPSSFRGAQSHSRFVSF